jgi:hypothetical protein
MREVSLESIVQQHGCEILSLWNSLSTLRQINSDNITKIANLARLYQGLSGQSPSGRDINGELEALRKRLRTCEDALAWAFTAPPPLPRRRSRKKKPSKRSKRSGLK